MDDSNRPFNFDSPQQEVSDFFQLFANEYRRETIRFLVDENEKRHQTEIGVNEVAQYLEDRIDNHSGTYELKIDLQHAHLPKIEEGIEGVSYGGEFNETVIYSLSEEQCEKLSKAVCLADEIELSYII